MRILIAEDDEVSRKLVFKFLAKYGDCDLTVNGLEALDAFLISLNEKKYYDLICLDIMMPKVDGVKVLNTIRNLEKEQKVPLEYRAKIIMVTALGDTEQVQQSFEIGCDAYAAKPVDMGRFTEVLQKLGFAPLAMF